MAQYKAALGLGADAAVPPVPQRFESTPLDVTSENLLASALENNTQIKGMEAEVRAAEAGIVG